MRVDPLLAFKLITFSVIALFAATALAVLLVSAKKERDFGSPYAGTMILAMVVAGLCAALALLFAYQIERQRSEAFRLERVQAEPVTAAL